MKATRTAIQLGTAISALALPMVSLASQEVPLPGTLLPVVSQSKVVGGVNPADTLYVTIGLQPRFPVELQAFCDSVSNPASPDYQHFITPEQVGEAFGASPSDVSNVVSFLKAQGMKVNLVADNGMAIMAQCTVAQAQTAFQTSLKQFSGRDADGVAVTFRSNTTPASVPANIAPVIVSISGLESYTRPKPLSTSTLTPPLARGLYQSAPAYTLGFHGEGRTVAFSNWVGLRTSQAPLYINQYGLPIPGGGAGTNITIVTVNSGASGGTENAEGDLDMQMELGMAPLANIRIYDNGQNDLVGVLTREAQDNLADVISESYGWQFNATLMASAHNQHLAMTAQGITYLAASGDSGTSIGGDPYPDIDPEVLIIGGTVATVDSNSGARQSEVAWSGGGGGWSTAGAAYNVHPAYQAGNGVPVGNNHRLVPDIAGQSAGNGNGADLFFYRNGLNSSFNGTSFASPMTAGLITILEQRLAAAGKTPRLGRMQDMIYAQNGRSDVWFDIVSGANGTLPDSTSSTAHAGWDFTSGWGAPNMDGWYAVLGTQVVNPSGFTISTGSLSSGTTGSLTTIDLNYLTINRGLAVSGTAPTIQVVFNGTAPAATAVSLKLECTGHVTTVGLSQTIELFDWTANGYVSVDTRSATLTDSSVEIVATNPGRFIQPGTKAVQARLSYRQVGPISGPAYQALFDQLVWKILP